jgi:subtilisin family serine protease
MTPLELVGLPALMNLTSGEPDVVIGLLDGPVALDHPELTSEHIHKSPGAAVTECDHSGKACQHGTFVAGILLARRGSSAPAICPDCSLLVHPIFSDATAARQVLPMTPQQLAAAINKCVDAGARVINLSAAICRPSTKDEPELRIALDDAARRGVIVVVAAGNQAMVGSNAITRHPWVLPVVGYGIDGRPSAQSNFGHSMGKRGLGAPGENVTSLTVGGTARTRGGTSFATAFVTGTIALLWSLYPSATAAQIKTAVVNTNGQRRSVVPPLLNARTAYLVLSRFHLRG